MWHFLPDSVSIPGVPAEKKLHWETFPSHYNHHRQKYDFWHFLTGETFFKCKIRPMAIAMASLSLYFFFFLASCQSSLTSCEMFWNLNFDSTCWSQGWVRESHDICPSQSADFCQYWDISLLFYEWRGNSYRVSKLILKRTLEHFLLFNRA